MKKWFLINVLLFLMLLSGQNDAMSMVNLDISTVNNNLNIFSNLGKFRLDKLISARRGGSFRGFRGLSRPRSSTRPSRSTRARSAARPSNPTKTPSFGGTRMSRQQATSKYGTPRKVQPMQGTNAAGSPVNYNVNHYGGFSSSLMTGYMMGNMAWWMMAPAMLYSRPVYVENSNGSIDVYPPKFDWGKLIMILIVIFVAVYIIKSMRRAKNLNSESRSQSSFI